MARNKWLYVGAATLVFVLGVWLYFREDIARWRKAKDQDIALRNKAYETLEYLKPTKPTQEELRAVRVVQKTMKFADGSEKAVVIVENFLPMMEARKGLPATVTRVRNRRDSSGRLYTLFWSEQGRYAIEFDWKDGGIRKCMKPNPNKSGRTPSEVPVQNRKRVMFSVTRDWSAKTDNNEHLFFHNLETKSKVKLANPWNEPVFIAPVYAVKGYAYGVAITADKKATGIARSLALFDVENPRFCGEVMLPKQTSGDPLKVVDAESNCVMCVDDYVKWMICVDLKTDTD